MKSKRRVGLTILLLASALNCSLVFAQSDAPRAAPSSSVFAPPGYSVVPAAIVKLRGGTFTMGCAAADNECRPDEKPAHATTIAAFWLDEHPVTVGQYEKCVGASACTPPRGAGEYFNWQRNGRSGYPVTGVDWYDAETYCQWMGGRLPAEAEYEFALRGGASGNIYPWGNESVPPTNFGNYADESAKRVFPEWKVFDNYDDGYVATSPVCAFTRNPLGLCDVSGNVWEWTADWYGKFYYASSPSTDPKGADTGEMRVLRGGSWHDPPSSDRASNRYSASPWIWSETIGFRCAR